MWFVFKSEKYLNIHKNILFFTILLVLCQVGIMLVAKGFLKYFKKWCFSHLFEQTSWSLSPYTRKTISEYFTKIQLFLCVCVCFLILFIKSFLNYLRCWFFTSPNNRGTQTVWVTEFIEPPYSRGLGRVPDFRENVGFQSGGEGVHPRKNQWVPVHCIQTTQFGLLKVSNSTSPYTRSVAVLCRKDS